jgi:hypothetical protein
MAFKIAFIVSTSIYHISTDPDQLYHRNKGWLSFANDATGPLCLALLSGIVVEYTYAAASPLTSISYKQNGALVSRFVVKMEKPKIEKQGRSMAAIV